MSIRTLFQAPAERQAAKPAFINLTLYGNPMVVAAFRKRLYIELLQRAETVVDMHSSIDDDQVCTQIRLRSNAPSPWPAITWLGALCGQMQVNKLHIGLGDAAATNPPAFRQPSPTPICAAC